MVVVIGPHYETTEFLTSAEAGQACNPPLTPSSIRAAAIDGRLVCTVRTRSGQRLFKLADVQAFDRERKAKKIDSREER